MKVWRRFVGAVKDRNSIWLARAVSRSATRNPDLEEAVVRATAHGEVSFDYKNAQRVFLWVRTSPASLHPLLAALGRRLHRTRSWPVALKGLILLHGVLSSSSAAGLVRHIPFDLSAFVDAASPRGYTLFVRAYFAFLDRKTAAGAPAEELIRLQQWQVLLDILVQVRPINEQVHGPLIIEAMGCVVVEIVSMYTAVREGVCGFRSRLPGAEREAERRVATKMRMQEGRLEAYISLCRDLGVANAKELPLIEATGDDMDVRGEEGGGGRWKRKGLETVVTYEWEKFEDGVPPEKNQRLLICGRGSYMDDLISI